MGPALSPGAVGQEMAACAVLGGVLGGWVAGRVFHRIDMVWLRRAFGLLLLYGGVRAVLLL